MRVTSFILAGAICLLRAQVPADDLRQGMEAFHRGDYETARHSLQRALEAFPGDGRARVFLALAQAGGGSCAEAIPGLKSQLAANPEMELRRLAGLALVQCYTALEQMTEVYPVIAELQSRFPADADVLYQAARVHMKAWNEAVFEMFRRTPASYRVNQLSAEIFETQGRYAEAAGEYRKAVAKNPAAINLHYRLGRALLLESHQPAALLEARKQFEAELALNPSDAVCHYQIGQVLLAEQKPTEAAARFEKSVRLSPEFPEALVALARTRLGAKRNEEAIELLERAVRLQPEMEAARYSLMLAYRNAGREEDALRQKAEVDRLRRPPEGEFTEFLKRLGEKAPKP
jgi:tetratricopeptide (TPR) repeat protein